MYRLVLELTQTTENMEMEILVEKYKRNCLFFNHNFQFYPSKELVMIQYCNMMLINQLLAHILKKSASW